MEHPNPNIWWKHRRRLAYMAFLWLVLQTFLFGAIAVFSPAAMAALGAVVGWSYGTTTIVLVGYFGNTAIEEVMKRKFNADSAS